MWQLLLLLLTNTWPCFGDNGQGLVCWRLKWLLSLSLLLLLPPPTMQQKNNRKSNDENCGSAGKLCTRCRRLSPLSSEVLTSSEQREEKAGRGKRGKGTVRQSAKKKRNNITQIIG